MKEAGCPSPAVACAKEGTGSSSSEQLVVVYMAIPNKKALKRILGTFMALHLSKSKGKKRNRVWWCLPRLCIQDPNQARHVADAWFIFPIYSGSTPKFIFFIYYNSKLKKIALQLKQSSRQPWYTTRKIC